MSDLGGSIPSVLQEKTHMINGSINFPLTIEAAEKAAQAAAVPYTNEELADLLKVAGARGVLALIKRTPGRDIDAPGMSGTATAWRAIVACAFRTGAGRIVSFSKEFGDFSGADVGRPAAARSRAEVLLSPNATYGNSNTGWDSANANHRKHGEAWLTGTALNNHIASVLIEVEIWDPNAQPNAAFVEIGKKKREKVIILAVKAVNKLRKQRLQLSGRGNVYSQASGMNARGAAIDVTGTRRKVIIVIDETGTERSETVIDANATPAEIEIARNRAMAALAAWNIGDIPDGGSVFFDGSDGAMGVFCNNAAGDAEDKPRSDLAADSGQLAYDSN